VKPDEVIALKETSRGIERFKNNLEACMMRPKWLEFDQNAMAGKVLAYPVRDDIDFPVEEHLIVELYSK
jgi:small subunit ribosomal protein S4